MESNLYISLPLLICFSSSGVCDCLGVASDELCWPCTLVMYDVKRAHSKRLTCCVQLSTLHNILKLRGEEVRWGDWRDRVKKGAKGGSASLSKQFFWSVDSSLKRPEATM